MQETIKKLLELMDSEKINVEDFYNIRISDKDLTFQGKFGAERAKRYSVIAKDQFILDNYGNVCANWSEEDGFSYRIILTD